MIKVSVIVPIYNTQKYLKRCLESIEQQSIDSYEVLLVNDGSTDLSKEICESFIQGKKQYKLINKENGGLSSARLYGWREASGEYVVFVDSDDYIEPTYCETLYRACIDNQCNLAICGYNVVNDNRLVHSYLLYNDITVLENIKEYYVKPLISYLPKEKYNIPGFLWLRIMKRDCITKDCFINENKVYAEDLIFDLEYAKHTNKIAIVHEPLYNYFMSANSLTRKYRPNLWNMYKDLYAYCTHYCQSENISNCQIRLKSLLLSGILHCVQQATCFRYRFFRKEFDMIRKDAKTRNALQTIKFLSKNYNTLLLNYKLIYCMMKFAPSKIVYSFYKWRQNR